MMAGRLASASFFSASVAVSASMAYPMYGTPQLLVAITVTMTTAVLIAAVAHIRRWTPLLQLGATIAALAVLAIPLAAPGALRGAMPLGESAVNVFSAIWTSWRRLTTIDLPVGTDDGLLMPVILLVLTSTVIGVGMILRTSRGELAALFPIAIMCWALLWGTPSPSPIWQPLLLATTTVAHVTILRQARRRRRAERTTSSLPRRFGAGLVAVVLAVLIGAGAALAADLGDRVVLREGPRDPEVELVATSPLAQFRANFDPETRGDVLMTVSGLSTDDRIRVATLDQYDGEVFSAGTSDLARTSGRAQGAVDSRQIGVSIQGYEGVWIPTVGQVESLTFVGPRAPLLSQSLVSDRDETLLAATEGLVADDGYSLMVQPSPTADSLQQLEPVDSEGNGAQLPVSALDWLAGTTAEASTPGEALASIVHSIRDEAYLSHGTDDSEAASRPGHSSARLDAVFSGEHLIGDQEQFAAATALMAREIGFPSRVVVGYMPPEGGTVSIRGHDATAWVEVHTSIGWVAIDVVPSNTGIPEEQETSSQPDQQPLPPVPPALPEGGQPNTDDAGMHTNPVQPPVDPADRMLWLRWVLVVVGLLLLLALPLATIVVIKLLRTRYRRSVGDPEQRALGAWRDFVDLAIDRGRDLEGDRTRQEYAGEDSQVLAFAKATDAAVFSRSQTDEETVDDLWRRRAELLGEIDRSRSGFDRLLSHVTLRSLTPQLFGVPASDAEQTALHRRRESTVALQE